MKIATFIAGSCRLDAYLSERNSRLFILIRGDDGEIKMDFRNGRELAYFIRFTAKLLAIYMARGRKTPREVLETVKQHAEAGVYEALLNQPVQTTLEGWYER